MSSIQKSIIDYLQLTGDISLFAYRFFQQAFRRPFEWKELLRQCFVIGYKSLFLVAVTGFIMGLVLTLQVRPTMMEFGAVAYMPQMISISIVREIVKQAEAIGERRFVTIAEPATREFRRIVRAMNSLSARVRTMLEEETERLEKLRFAAHTTI